MSKVTRRMAVGALAFAASAAPLAAQAPVQGDFQWYLGGQAGVLVFRTPAQTQGGMFLAGGHTLITARRTALLLSVDEGVGSDEQSAYIDASGTVQNVRFNDIRKYSAVLTAFPIRSAAQPYLGIGVGIVHIANPQPCTSVTSGCP
jgi:opacity protein-like surface antigen